MGESKNKFENQLIYKIVINTYRNWRNDRTMRLGAGLAYYGLFAFVPLITLMFGFATIVFSSQQVADFINQEFSLVTNPEVKQVTERIAESVANTDFKESFSALGIIGVGSLIVSSSFIFVALQDAFDVIWKNPVRKGWKKFVKKYVFSYLIVLSTSLLLFGALLINSIASLAKYLIPGDSTILDELADLVFSLGSWAIGIFVIAILFRNLTEKRIPWNVLIIGSAVTSVLIIIGTWLLSFYITTIANRSLSGAIGGIFLILIWIYYEAQIILIGAQLTKTLSMHKNEIVPKLKIR